MKELRQIYFLTSSRFSLLSMEALSLDGQPFGSIIDVMVLPTQLIIQTNGSVLQKNELISILDEVKTQIEQGNLPVPGINIGEGNGY